ncbi:MAG TPA: hypothetical protein VGH73_20165 [Thermoanaerobaculia bacterium]|jgi:hypothetical protein
MRDDEIDSLEFPPDDPRNAKLDQLETDEDFGAPDEPPPVAPALSRREIDDLVEKALDEELKRLNGPAKRTG